MGISWKHKKNPPGVLGFWEEGEMSVRVERGRVRRGAEWEGRRGGQESNRKGVGMTRGREKWKRRKGE